METQIVVRGAAIGSGTATTLTHSDLHAHNTFERNDVVIPRAEAVQPSSGTLVHTFPAASVTTLVLKLT